MMNKLLKGKRRIAICGDFNIEMVNESEQGTKSSLNLLRIFNLHCSNSKPTRDKACIDNIIVNFKRDLYTISVVGGAFADHGPILLRLNQNKTKGLPSNADDNIEEKVTWFKGLNGEAVNLFIQKLRALMWDCIYHCQTEINETETALGNSLLFI